MLSETVLLTIGLGCVAALLVVALFGAMKRELKRISAAFGAVPMVVKALFLICGVSFYLHGSLKTNNTTNAASTMMYAARPSIQTTEFINQTEMYVNAWNATGVWEDSFWCTFENDFVFPFGTNHLKGVEVLAWGEIWSTHRKDAVLADLSERVAIGRDISQFSCEYFAASETNEAKYVYSWYNGLVNRETNRVVNGRIELRRSGDILVATNGVEQLIPRQLPFEHNGFGQDIEWVTANFTNSNEILSVGYSEWVDDQVGVNLTNGLYKLTVTVPEKPLETTQLKVGDYSVAVTNAGEYVFLLEKGITYPLSFYGDMDNLVYEWDDGGGGEMPTAYNLPRNQSNYSVEVSSYCDLDNPVYFDSPMDDGEGFILYHPIVTISPSYEVDPVEPLCLFAFVSDNIFSPYAEIKWIADDRVIGTGEMLFLYDLSQYSYIKVEVRHRDSLIEGSVYINRYVRDTLVNLSSGGVIVTEGAYTNAPNEVVSESSTSVDLNINYQLTDSGEFKLECDEANGLEIRDETGNVVSLPLEWDGYYNEDAERVYSVTASDINAIGTKTFTLTYTPDAGGDSIIREINVDVVKIRVEAEADWPSNKVRHVFGPGEYVNIYYYTQTESKKNISVPYESGSHTISINYNQQKINISINVLDPQWPMRYEYAGNLTDADWRYHKMLPLVPGVPGVGFRVKRFLLPTYVSFSQIVVMEDYAKKSGVFGFFETYEDDDRFDHTELNGAKKGVKVGNLNNQVGGVDLVAFQLNELPLQEGGFYWSIPIRWGPIGGPYNKTLGMLTQEFFVDAEGACTISKGGVSRTRRKEDY